MIIWSVASEPQSDDSASEDYFRDLITHLKSLDTTRPVTIPNNLDPQSEYAGQFVDIATVNTYIGWASDFSDLDVITSHIIQKINDWNEIHKTPVLLTQFGPETLEGLHTVRPLN